MHSPQSDTPSIRFVSINIEYNLHLHRVLPFLAAEQPDIICMQEVFVDDLPQFEQTLGMHSYFVPLTLRQAAIDRKPVGEHKQWGIALLSKQPLSDVQTVYYATYGRQAGDVIPFDGEQTSVQKALLSGELPVGPTTMRIATTHFTWTPDAGANDAQREDLANLLPAMAAHPSILLAGDFNAPRGGEICNAIEERYTDHVPQGITTTLDQELHRVKGLQHVVDHIFTTDDYIVSDVRVVSGVSDHCALVATVSKQAL